MATTEFPVLTWPDAEGGCTAVLVGDLENRGAHAASLKEALHQLKELLEWRVENEPWNLDPDFTRPELIEMKVDVLPQYTDGKRVTPCPEPLTLRIPCVTGVQENGLLVCAVPHLGLRFSYQDPLGLRNLVTHYVREALRGRSTLELAGRLPPRNCCLDKIILRDSIFRTRQVPPANRPELKLLFAVADPLLQDLGRKRAVSAAYGRDSLVETLVSKLRQGRGSVLLVGESGVGKTTILIQAAKRLAREQNLGLEKEEAGLRAYRFWRGSGGRIVAGMRFLGEWQERCEQFLERLNALEGVFCAEDLLELVRVGGEDAGDSVAAFLLPYLQRGELRMVAEATPAEVEACRRLLPALLDVFQVCEVPLFDDDLAIEVLDRVANSLATSARLTIEPGVTRLVHRLFKRFYPYAAFPGPAALFLRTLCTPGRDVLRQVPNSPAPTLTTRIVVDQFIKQTGLPELFLRDDLPLALDNVRKHFESQIIGQPEATLAAARLVTTIKTGLNDPGRPFGVLLFCGPTGVGKTALARVLAEFCFGAAGQKDRLVRLDMSEYGGWGAATRLLQSPKGDSAAWIERVRLQPFCVLLFDEIEKAAPEVFDVILGLLDEGRLTDRFGRVSNFRSAVIILTSNLGSSATGPAGFLPDSGPAYESEVAKFFRPEFFNRLDAVIAFKSLAPAEVMEIARKELEELAAREGFASARIRLEWSQRLVAAVAREGYDQRLGARPLQRALERLVVTHLARWRVAHPTVRDTVLRLDLRPDGTVVICAEK